VDYYVYHDFMMHTKSITYILMGLFVLGFWGIWAFMTSRDEELHKFPEHDKE